MKNDNQNEPVIQLLEDNAVEGERTPPGHRLCAGCGADLAGRRPDAKFCTARCRTAARRIAHTDDINRHLAIIEASLAAVRKLGGQS